MKLKILVTGPYAAGKTTFIQTISEIEVVTTEEVVTSSEELKEKGHTTVAMDYGKITLEDDIILYLFGTPGQVRFDFMWDILCEGALGVVVLVDSAKVERIKEARPIIDYFYSRLQVPYIVAANKQDLPDAWPPEYVRSILDLDSSVKVVPCIATDRESVKGVLLELLDDVLGYLRGDKGL